MPFVVRWEGDGDPLDLAELIFCTDEWFLVRCSTSSSFQCFPGRLCCCHASLWVVSSWINLCCWKFTDSNLTPHSIIVRCWRKKTVLIFLICFMVNSEYVSRNSSLSWFVMHSFDSKQWMYWEIVYHANSSFWWWAARERQYCLPHMKVFCIECVLLHHSWLLLCVCEARQPAT